MIVFLGFIVFLVTFSSGSVFKEVCPTNEYYSNCVRDCSVCGDPNPVNCNDKVCTWGCECDEGFVRIKRPNGVCIPLEECEYCKRPDFEFKECGSKCGSTCNEVRILRNVCPNMCEPGCYCKGNKVLDEATNKCVAPGECKKKRK